MDLARRCRQPTVLAAAVVATLALAPALTSCAYLREAIGLGPRRPKVQLVDIAVSKATMTRLDLVVVLRVDNPNDFALSFSRLRYKLVAAELPVASGILAERVSIPAEAHASVKLPVTVDPDAALKLARLLLASKEEIYAVLTATADFETPLGAMEVGFEEKKPLSKLAGL